MKRRIFLLALLAALPLNALADTELTIYNQNLALIKKSMNKNMDTGINNIAFDEIAQQLLPESVFIYGRGLRVLEQNYDYAAMDYMNMLKANIGKDVRTVRVNPANGENIYEKARLLAADGMMPVLKFDYGIEANFPGRVLFENVPAGLNQTPVLRAKVETTQAGEKEINLAYLARGFSWQANYIARTGKDKTLTLLGRAAVSNNSGSDYKKAHISLIAGDINTVTATLSRSPVLRKNTVFAAGITADAGLPEAAPVMEAPVSLNSYYIYNIPDVTELRNGQMKQVSFLNAPAVKYEKTGEITSTLYFNTGKPYYKDIHPNIIYRFENTAENGLGLPLPQGKISFYDHDKAGTLQFIGENSLKNNTKGQEIRLNIGRFFDVYADGRIDELKKIKEEKAAEQNNRNCTRINTLYSYNVSYTLTNKGDEPAEIILKQPLPDEAEIISESQKGEKGDGNIHQWRLTLQPDTEQTIKLVVQSPVSACR